MTQGQHISIDKYPGKYRELLLRKSHVVMVCFIIAFTTLPALAEIRGSAHDFTSYGWSGDEICAVCHLPHAQNGPNGQLPLWSHEISSASYSMYRSATLSQVPEQLDSSNVSRLCLSCHDGTIALDSFGGNQGVNYIPEGQSLGTDLSDDHPIGVKPIHQNEGEIAMREGGVKYYDGKVECPSCHDVHNNQVLDDKLLRVPRTGSALCLQCHDK